jgi:AraC-like DNA-binding protein
LIVGSRFVVSGVHADMLLAMLPAVVHIRKESDQASREQQPGGFLFAEHQAHMMLVQALRLHLSEPLEGQTGWLAALADKPISLVINAMHQDPARRWTLQDLAERAGMSRSSFALKFRATADETPMTYLTRWRMLLAGD